MSFMNAIRKMTGGYNEEDEDQDLQEDDTPIHSAPQFSYNDDDDDAAASSSSSFGIRATSSLSSRSTSIPSGNAIKVVVPKKFEEVSEIADQFKHRNTILLNLEQMDDSDIIHLIDFLAGVAYITDGRLEKVANMAYALVPANIEISGIFNEQNGLLSK